MHSIYIWNATFVNEIDTVPKIQRKTTDEKNIYKQNALLSLFTMLTWLSATSPLPIDVSGVLGLIHALNPPGGVSLCLSLLHLLVNQHIATHVTVQQTYSSTASVFVHSTVLPVFRW